MTLLQTYVLRNPMMLEGRRVFRKVTTIGLGAGALGRVASMVLVVAYLVGLIVYAECANPWSADTVLILELATLTLVPIFLFYPSIAGERDRRSWDFLRSAPLTQGQIVAGKFLTAAASVVALWLLIQPFYFLSDDRPDKFYSFGFAHGERIPAMSLLSASLLTLLFAVMIVAVTLFFSARCRHSLTTLALSLAFLFVVSLCTLGIAPGLDSPTPVYDSIITMHPIVCGRVLMRTQLNTSESVPLAFFLPAFAYLSLTIGFLFWTVQTLVFAEGDVPFLPDAHQPRRGLLR